ncbi:uncharacterized protein BYT42DRAFT_578969 [Radiomyces spectabilis]|uniref:uncharacterized protein n=1 Tax=Radiomyces spectabilis TaxID=64574 RepID=UPI0022208A0D|nr:uncharacterized protein BYT42DRAFT_578969 [Radiomyces spectabilis]KAI8373029.1 hypothetical protein BYT42DRAFT_578969 [Radiomyces spectabilis]
MLYCGDPYQKMTYYRHWLFSVWPFRDSQAKPLWWRCLSEIFLGCHVTILHFSLFYCKSEKSNMRYPVFFLLVINFIQPFSFLFLV